MTEKENLSTKARVREGREWQDETREKYGKEGGVGVGASLI